MGQYGEGMTTKNSDEAFIKEAKEAERLAADVDKALDAHPRLKDLRAANVELQTKLDAANAKIAELVAQLRRHHGFPVEAPQQPSSTIT